ncbi:ubiquitin-conjugating enzyme/RWD-like protein [Crepidotus variabilis]|uniref:E2 ubiquitin-conjugating enzyme n=1 Tax=Crepidotus variabilis TaxID=179855 RepID=A0A9P6JQE7_9AGAR|nr:ubiquitin-conjugating enzyme/RWD-like protein [Crepidotus variabilis]
MSVPPSVVRRIMRELKELEHNPPEGIRIQTSDEDMLDVTGIIEGPEGTPYAGGYFRVKFRFTNEFPAAPPKCWFATKIFHPNVGPTGEICVNTLKKDWKPEYGIGQILVTVKCLLIYPNPESALDEEAGKLLLEEYASYCERAKLITSVHATPRVKPVEFNTLTSQAENPPAPKATSSSKEPSEPVASTSKSGTSSSHSNNPPTPPTKIALHSTTKSTPLNIPTITRKSASPAPTSLKASPNSKEGLSVGSQKERHVSPSPLGPADSNVGKPGTGVGLGMAPTGGVGTLTGTKAVKRAATNSAPTNAEKRKKALKRL